MLLVTLLPSLIRVTGQICIVILNILKRLENYFIYTTTTLISPKLQQTLRTCVGNSTVDTILGRLNRWLQPCEDIWNSGVLRRQSRQQTELTREEYLWRVVFQSAQIISDSVRPVLCYVSWYMWLWWF